MKTLHCWTKMSDTISIQIVNPCFYCDNYHRTLTQLIDSSGQNPSWFCNNCSIKVFPTEELRSKSILSAPDGPVEEPIVTLT